MLTCFVMVASPRLEACRGAVACRIAMICYVAMTCRPGVGRLLTTLARLLAMALLAELAVLAGHEASRTGLLPLG